MFNTDLKDLMINTTPFNLNERDIQLFKIQSCCKRWKSRLNISRKRKSRKIVRGQKHGRTNSQPLTGMDFAAESSGRASKKYIFNFKSFVGLLETNQSLILAPAGSEVQPIPTSPEILDAGVFIDLRWGVALDEVGDSALLPIIVVVSFHHSTLTILEEKTYSIEDIPNCTGCIW